MNMMNNLLMMLMGLMRSGGNPMALLQQMAGRDPQVAQFMRMLNGKNAHQLQQMAENVAKEKGVSINDVARQLGLDLLSNR